MDSHEELNFIEEYNEFSGLPKHIAVTYKFFSLFSVSSDSISWSKRYTDQELEGDVLKALKLFLKNTKNRLRSDRDKPVTSSECSKLMLFWYMKIQEYDLFTPEIRREIMKYMELCELVIC